ncbi:FkbM family methyltransferase [Sphingomonas sp. DG1-23]|uniref:FkbM family methyltransferase n=1 Tax=Sphingomonas sp. DG1-23 TaxID=3068316 RepID=UPI00273F500A|nr:FkbM family methyltransferase [Sphingomonas sp. DG1-23]MDP5279866.1 FkbM family methyltransferase [Sphingomonas sp. DG1-23]
MKQKLRKRKPTVLFCTTNGAGMGHLTRALSVAKSLEIIDDSRDIVFLISTPDLSITRAAGFTTYYVPYFADIQGDIGWENWNDFVRLTAQSIFRNHAVELVVFDGYVPFFGLIDALDRVRDIARIWIRRGMEKPESTQLPDEIEAAFDYLLRPQEAGAAPVAFDGKSISVDPIISFDPQSLCDRAAAREKLGIPAEAVAVYVQLGSGAKVSIENVLRDVISALAELSQIYVVLGMSPLGRDAAPALPRGKVLRSYPNFPHLNAFDFAISAAGYNAVHEFLACGLPAILIPRESPQDTEDQLARALSVEQASAGLVMRYDGGGAAFQTGLRDAIRTMLLDEVRARMSEAAHRLLPSTGAHAAAAFVAKVRSPDPERNARALASPPSTAHIPSLDELRRIARTDEPELTLVGKLVGRGSTAIDVGGDIGLYALSLSDAGARVLVFECRPDAVRQLRFLFEGRDVEIIPTAASDRNGAASLFVPAGEGRMLGSRASLVETANNGAAQIRHPVMLQRIDALTLEHVDLIKIDVEGHELEVLRGASALIARCRPVLLVEIEDRHHPGRSGEIFQTLERCGYRGWYLHRGTLRSAENFDFAHLQQPGLAKTAGGQRHPDYINNFFFLPAEREAELLSRLGVSRGVD